VSEEADCHHHGIALLLPARVLSGNVVLNTSTSRVSVDGGTLAITGQVSDSVVTDLSKVGVGTLELDHANTYRGMTSVYNGVLTVSDAQALGSDTSATPQNGTYVYQTTTPAMKGTLAIKGPSVSSTGATGITILHELLTIESDGFGGAGALDNIQGNNTWSSPVTLGSSTFTGNSVIIQVDSDATSGDATSLTRDGVAQDQSTSTPTSPRSASAPSC
jgi:autotransporter-associated beta strand protein